MAKAMASLQFISYKCTVTCPRRNIYEIKYSYTMVGGQKFYDRKEIKDLLSYLRIVANSNDDISLQRIINVPKEV